jgi:hypothetical protein
MMSMRGLRPRLVSYSPLATSDAIRSKIGNPNAKVLPVPVRDLAKQSRPSKSGSNACLWMSVNWEMPFASSTLRTPGDI